MEMLILKKKSIDNKKKLKNYSTWKELNCLLSHVVASGRDIMPCIKIDKPLVVYLFSIMTMLHM